MYVCVGFVHLFWRDIINNSLCGHTIFRLCTLIRVNVCKKCDALEIGCYYYLGWPLAIIVTITITIIIIFSFCFLLFVVLQENDRNNYSFVDDEWIERGLCAPQNSVSVSDLVELMNTEFDTHWVSHHFCIVPNLRSAYQYGVMLSQLVMLVITNQ